MNKKIFFFLASIIFITAGTICAIKWANGYRPDLKKGQIKGTGLLVVNSFPNGAQVYINDKLTTATDNTLNLPPGEYKIKIQKDGFLAWEKTLKLEKELVKQTNAQLFPSVPELKPLTFSGAFNPTPSSDGNKIAYSVASASAQLKNGLWVEELANKPLTFSRGPRQLAQSTTTFPFEKAKLLWSPDSSQILAIFLGEKGKPYSSILLDSSRLNRGDELLDVTARLSIIFSEWEQELALKERERLKLLPVQIEHLATESAKNWYFSPDEKKALYIASKDSQLPNNIIPAVPASNNQPEERDLKENRLYVYDFEEDKNFFIKELKTDEKKILLDQALKATSTTTNTIKEYQKLQQGNNIEQTIKNFQAQYSPLPLQNVQWFPTSSHLIKIEDSKIIISEYDHTNQAVVYAGPFANNFVYPWPDGSRLLILASLNPGSPLNLYMINLK